LSPADPQELIPTSSDWVPAWLGPQDHPWLEALLDELRRFEGRTLREWRARAAEPLRAPCPPGRQRRVAALLSARCTAEPAPVRPAPRERRLAVFLEAQRRRDAGAFERGAVLAALAEPLCAAPESLAEALYGDVPSERRIALGSAPADAPALALESNLALAQGLLRSSV
jgi:predicted nuclease of restriction endonuclease-like RecB superfamily